MPVPILFFGDSPTLKTGLSRIGRDLAVRVSGLPEFRVGFLGRGGIASRQLPFPQYTFPEHAQWGEGVIEHAWADFSNNQHGVIMSIWDASRLLWFAQPQKDALPAPLYEFLTSGRFQRWGYFPVDSSGPGDRLTGASCATISAYERPLAYSIWGSQVMERSIDKPVDWIPHGFNANTFQPRDREAYRTGAGLNGRLLIGCVMANTPRKDWGLAFSTMALLRQKHPNLHFWAHVDVMARSYAWDLDALIHDYRAADWTTVTITGSMSDKDLSYAYSACDLTILPSLGEGFGFPLVESLACGTPAVHGSYGGGAELLPDRQWLVEPVAWRLDTLHNALRPVFEPAHWAEAIERVLDAKVDRQFCRDAVGHLDWKALWPATWQKWFLQGLKA